MSETREGGECSTHHNPPFSRTANTPDRGGGSASSFVPPVGVASVCARVAVFADDDDDADDDAVTDHHATIPGGNQSGQKTIPPTVTC